MVDTHRVDSASLTPPLRLRLRDYVNYDLFCEEPEFMPRPYE